MDETRRRWLIRALVGVLAFAVGAGIAVAVRASNDGGSVTATPSPSTSTSSASPSASPSATAPSPGPSAQPSAPTTAPRTAAGSVTVTIRPFGCRDCRITAYSTVDGVPRSLGTRIAEQGFPTWTVPVQRTRGMAFTITDLPGIGVGNAATAIVMQYQGVAPGTPIAPSEAAAAASGTYCWAGTNRSTTITVQVERFESASESGDPETFLRAYANPMRTGSGGFVATTQGALGVQDDPVCPAG